MMHLSTFLSMLAALVATASAAAHQFKPGDKIPTYVNKVGPYYNPHETYHYYSLPVCAPEKIVSRSLTLGEVLDGDRMANSLYDIRFKENKDVTPLCTLKLTRRDVDKLIDAIEDLYYFEFVIDDLPVRGFIGRMDQHVIDFPSLTPAYLFTHIQFHIQYNGDQIVSINVTEKLKEVELLQTMDETRYPFEVPFTYSVKWTENTKIPFSQRAHFGKKFFPTTLEIHWLSVINSVVLVMLLMGFVGVIIARALNKDFARYSKADDQLDFEDDLSDDQGWKIIHADVFRFPSYKHYFCAIIGNGTQFLALGFCLVFMALAGFFNVHRHHAMSTATVILYAVTCAVSGYTSTKLFVQLEGKNWAWNIVITACFFAVPFFVCWSIINTVSWTLGSTQALPATTIILLGLIWLLIGFPLTVIGGIFGRKTATPYEAPCRTKPIAREIPEGPFYRSAFAQMLAGGFLPFSAISVELYYVFATMWGREHYTLYGILLLVFFILLAVTASMSIALTYFQLSAEDYRWWWRSVFSAGFTGVFVFVYSVFYFFFRSNMTGLLQTVQFFGYTMLACFAFFLMLGAVGFYSSHTFVRYIYKNIKID